MDHAKRTRHLAECTARAGADWVLVHHLPNIRYLSGFTGSHAILLIGGERRIFITDGRYQEQVKREVNGYEIVIQEQRKDLDVVAEALGGVSDKTVWFEGDHLAFSEAEEYRAKLGAKEFVGRTGLVETPRRIKDADEIEAMRRALNIAEEAWRETLEEIREGMTERELAHALEDAMWRRGAERESFETLLQFGPNSSLPHGKAGGAKLKKGQNILMDFGCVIDGYCSDITRTVFFGPPSAEMRTVYETVRAANETAIENIRAGVSCKEADAFARRVIGEAGYGERFMHGLGHGVGLDIHEDPRLSKRFDGVLTANHVVTIEPGIYLEGTGGVRIEDMVVVGESGCQVLNQTPKDLLVI